MSRRGRTDVRPEGEREADDDPDDADEGQAEEAVHDRREDVLATDEPAVEEGETRQHDHDQGGRHQQPGGISSVHSSIPPKRAVRRHVRPDRRLGTGRVVVPRQDRQGFGSVPELGGGAGGCGWASASRPGGATLRVGPPIGVDVPDGLVADDLVDVVRRRVRVVGEQEAEAPAGVELGLAHLRDEGARVAPAAGLGRRIDGADPDAVGCRATDAGQGYGFAVVLPQLEGSVAARIQRSVRAATSPGRPSRTRRA